MPYFGVTAVPVNTDKLALENVNLTANHRGQLDVNDHYQTPAENIYAAGDVIGWPSLASAAYGQGASAAAFIRHEENLSSC